MYNISKITKALKGKFVVTTSYNVRGVTFGIAIPVHTLERREPLNYTLDDFDDPSFQPAFEST